MTRKRFIKLLMARGIQRNKANVQANYVYLVGSYSALYNEFYLNGGYYADNLSKALETFANNFYKSISHTAELVSIMFKTLISKE